MSDNQPQQPALPEFTSIDNIHKFVESMAEMDTPEWSTNLDLLLTSLHDFANSEENDRPLVGSIPVPWPRDFDRSDLTNPELYIKVICNINSDTNSLTDLLQNLNNEIAFQNVRGRIEGYSRFEVVVIGSGNSFSIGDLQYLLKHSEFPSPHYPRGLEPKIYLYSVSPEFLQTITELGREFEKVNRFAFLFQLLGVPEPLIAGNPRQIIDALLVSAETTIR